MERTIEFKNFEQSSTQISADLYIDGEFVVRLVDTPDHVLRAKPTDIILYEYFRQASRYYLNQKDNCSVEYAPSASATAH